MMGRLARAASGMGLANGFLLGLLAVGLVGPLLAPGGYEVMDLRMRLSPPLLFGGSLNHPLGTDDLGRDVLIRLVYSIRITMIVACLATAIGACIGITLGILAAHFRGWVDDLMMIAIDFQAALPYLLLVLAILTVFGNGFVIFITVLGLYGWERYARLTRGLTLSAQKRGYAVAVRSLGAGPLRLYMRHLLPNMASILITNCTLALPQVILLESSLSFLGLGIQPPRTSLGSMVGFGRDYLTTAWWIAVAPILVIFLISVAITALGNRMRDSFDPMLGT
jgi:peptide/nickel transport system permease protein